MGWVVNPTPRLLDSWERYAVPISQEAGWIPGPVRTGAKNIACNGIRSLDRPTRSESQCQANYPGPEWKRRKKKFLNVSLRKRVFQHIPQMASETTETQAWRTPSGRVSDIVPTLIRIGDIRHKIAWALWFSLCFFFFFFFLSRVSASVACETLGSVKY